MRVRLLATAALWLLCGFAMNPHGGLLWSVLWWAMSLACAVGGAWGLWVVDRTHRAHVLAALSLPLSSSPRQLTDKLAHHGRVLRRVHAG